jgi:methylmalonyl-CoA mutase N-terminal domain/subunit
MSNDIKKIAEERKKWELKREHLEKKMPPRSIPFTTLSDMEVPLLSTPDDLETIGFDFEKDLGFPGEFPFTRGVQANMYRGKLWTMRQFAGFSSPEHTNKRFKMLLEAGQTGLSTAFDMPTLMGYDCDSPKSLGTSRHGRFIRRHSARRRHGFHDHQWSSDCCARHVLCDGRKTRHRKR